ncbi:helix-turn-helix transcriptional regulator [Aestuariirhabdus sp. Z084]|uniref:response regulator transcription factor n=1 Tax=Aestuariirhabdus haliotis TaxID=2918751 RepID=UPI00201B3D47|nr:helix-turn-helix transcriptional regulator [Aestuariirhabdus haliotis]MCL6414370.1 helix-turn-helix transcriptional regulator [Aestuariirhabdus haliotis]MCL6418302.1 helix-turn-helix transcriptional regulator [Aestuariirhabdus haliotis]
MTETSIDLLIGRLYRATSRVELDRYRRWALEQLRELVAFDGAIWSSGHASTMSFYNHTLMGVPAELVDELLRLRDINPLTNALISHPGEPVDMAEVIDDKAFYQSPIYHECFEPHGIQRILSSLHLDQRSGLITLLTLYRFSRDKPFSETDKQVQRRMLYHLLSAASHNCLLHLDRHQPANPDSVTALCDRHGIYHEVQQDFIDCMEHCFPGKTSSRLPFDIEQGQGVLEELGYSLQQEAIGDLYCIDVWPRGPMDQLTLRERQVVEAICRGQTFKATARQLGLSPSTVSNHLYRIYQKLGVTSRNELATLVVDR